jgi:hypothetical protein
LGFVGLHNRLGFFGKGFGLPAQVGSPKFALLAKSFSKVAQVFAFQRFGFSGACSPALLSKICFCVKFGQAFSRRIFFPASESSSPNRN